MSSRERKLYLVTDYTIDFPMLLEKVEKALKGGVSIVQYRAKNISTRDMCTQALKLKKICHKYNALFIVNDRVDVAIASDADGVHLGQDDMKVCIAKFILPKGKIIGATVHNKEQALEAIYQGANSLGVGAIYPTLTKNDATPMGEDTLKEIRECSDITIYGIGGITPENMTIDLLKYVDGVAVVSSILNSNNPKKVCEEFLSKL